MNNEWIEVGGYKDLPVGTWLVELDKDRNPYHVAVVHPNVTVIGGAFGFDRHKVLRYKALDVS